jgi:hypothetical protein
MANISRSLARNEHASPPHTQSHISSGKYFYRKGGWMRKRLSALSFQAAAHALLWFGAD